MRNLSNPSQGDRSQANPFIDDTYVENATALPGVPEIHTGAMSQCLRLFENLVRDGERGQHWGNSGRTVLIASPRAGYGKSHLIGRLRSVTESLVAGLTLPFERSRNLTWQAILSSVLRQYQENRCPQHVGCSLLDETARFFASNIIQAALAEGAITDRDIPETEVSLRMQYRDVMAPDSGTKMLPWLRKRLPELSIAAARPMGSHWKLTERSISFWGKLFLDQIENRGDALESLRGLTDGEARERVLQFLRIATECRPAAIVADHLDGFFGSETAGMTIAEILTSLRSEVPRSLTLLCVNEDVWESVFEKKLPSAWLDRLTGEPASLGGIGVECAIALISGRLQSMGIPRETSIQFANHVRVEERWDDAAAPALFPRDVIRLARRQWECVGGQFMARTQAAKPATSPIPAPPYQPAPPAQETASFQPPQTPPQHQQQPTTPIQPLQSPNLAPIFGARADQKKDEPAPNPIASQIQAQQQQQQQQEAAQNFQPTETPQSPARNLTGIDSIINEIRGAGGRAVSDTGAVQSPHGNGNGNQTGTPQVPDPTPDIPRNFQAGALNVSSIRPESGVSSANPFSAGDDPEQRLQDLEMELLTVDASQMQWDLRRIEGLIRKVGRKYDAVGQIEEAVPGSENGALRWTVKGQVVLLGFEPPHNAYFWNTLLKRAVATNDSAKMTVLSNTAEPFDARTLASFGVDQATAMRYVDVVELSEGDMALLYASEIFLKEAEAANQVEGAIQIIARRLDPFWRRLTRPLAAASGA